MAADWRRRLGLSLAVLLFTGLILTGRTTPRQYPQREPVRFWHRWGGEWEKVVNEIVRRFNESQDRYEVIPLSTPSGGADAKFMLGAIGGDPPDVMSMWNGAIPAMASNGLLTPLDELMSERDRQVFFEESFPVVRQSGMVKGKAYGVTIGSDLYALYINQQHLEEAGIDPNWTPKTIEELIEVGSRLHRRNAQGRLTRLGYLLTGFGYASHAFGGGFADPTTGELTLQHPNNLRCLNKIVEERRKIGFEEVTKFYAGLDTASDKGGWPFISGNLSITLDGQWRVEEIRKYAPKMRYRVVPLPPAAEGGKALAGWVSGNFMIIPATAKHKRGAWEFIKFWSGIEEPDRAAACYNMGGWLPLSPAVANSPTYRRWVDENPQFQPFLDILASPNCRAMPAVPYLQFLLDRIGRAEDRAVRGFVTPEVALRELQASIDQELEKRRRLGYEE